MAIKKSGESRQLYLRKKLLDLAMKTNNGHIASSLSCIDIIDSIYNVMDKNDHFILSKGHAALALYTVLIERGFSPDVYKLHPDIDIKNGIEISSGSLGHGLPVAVGMALSKKLKKEKGNIIVLIGDGECQEGTTWESLMVASYHGLDNLMVIIDNNKIQALDYVNNVSSMSPLLEKFVAFGASVIQISGHSTNMIKKNVPFGLRGTPNVIIANTIKGKGISFIENSIEWHNRLPNKEELDLAYKELS